MSDCRGGNANDSEHCQGKYTAGHEIYGMNDCQVKMSDLHFCLFQNVRVKTFDRLDHF